MLGRELLEDWRKCCRGDNFYELSLVMEFLADFSSRPSDTGSLSKEFSCDLSAINNVPCGDLNISGFLKREYSTIEGLDIEELD